MKVSYLACLKTINPSRALPIDKCVLIVQTAVQRSQDATPGDRPYFDLIEKQSWLGSPHLRGDRQRLGG